MFRGGGKVNSEGTGITSGLADREPYAEGKIVGGGQMGRTQILSGQPFNLLDYLRGFRPENFTAGGQMSRTTEPSGAGVDLTPSIIPEANAEELLYGDLNIELKKKPPIPEIKETTSTVTDLAKGTEEGAKKAFKGLEDDEDLDDITLDDFEQEITKKAELYEKLLAGKGSKKKSIFQALTAAAPGLLEEDYGEAIKAAGEVLGESDDLSRKARLLAIQEKIAKDAQKTPTKAQEVDILAKRYIANGMKEADAYIAAEKKVYGDEKTSELPGPSEARELYQLTSDFAKSDDDLIAQNPSGFAQAELYKRQGIQTIPYEPFYDKNSQTTAYRATVTDKEIQNGEFYFDPITFKFKYKTRAGEDGFTYNLNEAREKIS